MFATLRFILVILAGVFLGLASAWWAVESLHFEGARNIGQWSMLEDGGKLNPYEAVRAAQRGGGGLGPSEGVELLTDVDAENKPLKTACTYLVGGSMPAGALWTLTVSDRDGRLPTNPASRFGFTSVDAMVFGPARQIHVLIGPQVQPGDFVPTTGLAHLRLTLRLYSPTLATRMPSRDQLPSVTMYSCEEGEKS